MNKKTLICIHVMPLEIEMFERFMGYYANALGYLDKDDDVTIRATLNLNPELTDWDNSELKQDFFINKFARLFNGVKNINEIILDTSLWGTTQQKRESINLDYDQFIFCDTDIAIPPQLLKLQLIGSYKMDGMYIISPSIPKWWDDTWDIIVNTELLKNNVSAFEESTFNSVFSQNPSSVNFKQISQIKFGCGMHTLYSKQFWRFVGIPESFGGYGPEDTYGMMAGNMAIQKGYDIKQYVLDGLYITEDYTNRIPSISDKVKPNDVKKTFYERAQSFGRDELIKFSNRI